MRITQQKACYAAQEVLDRTTTFASIEEVQAWVDGLRDTRWWHLRGYSLTVLRIEVGAAPADSTDRGVAHWNKSMNAGRIEVTPDGMCGATALHEVAHVLADAVHESTGHDPKWASTYLALVALVMGPQEYVKLRDSFIVHGVRFDFQPQHPTRAFAL